MILTLITTQSPQIKRETNKLITREAYRIQVLQHKYICTPKTSVNKTKSHRRNNEN